MIPTLILFGLVFGRWWRFALAAAAFGWPLTLVLLNDMDSNEWAPVAAALLAVANTAVGVAVHQAALWSVRSLRRQRRTSRNQRRAI
jgi:hypothetical protein